MPKPRSAGLRASPALLLALGIVLTAIRCPTVRCGATAAGGGAPAAAAVAAAAPFGRRADHLLRQLTLDEKVSQLDTNSPAVTRNGTVLIPAFNWWSECLHGAVEPEDAPHGATVFPQSIGLAASFDRRLVARVAAAVGDELRAKSNEAERQGAPPRMTNCFGPNINIVRDPRWGRAGETFGEDPYLTAEMARAFVRALQGSHPRYLKAGATCKHYAAYSLEEWEGDNRVSFDARLDPRDVRDTYLPAFEACTAEASSTMCSYNAVNGTPACANEWLLQRQLRERMGFRGFVVSDCGAVQVMVDNHLWAATQAEAAAAALKAGTDLACLDYSALRDSLAQGLVSERDVDRALRRLLLARLALGHFDKRHPYSHIPPSVIGSPEHLALAREAAAQSFVLLKNDPPAGSERLGGVDGGAATAERAGLLPLQLGSLRRILVLGPFANRSEYMLGSYYGKPSAPPLSPYQALQQRVAAHNRRLRRGGGGGPGGGEVELELVTGTEVTGQPVNTEDAVESCRDADVCLLLLGITSNIGGVDERHRFGSYTAFSPTVEAEVQDRLDVRLPGYQLHLAQAVAKRTRTPLVVLLVHGGPLDVSWLQASPRVASILSIWSPGQGVEAVVDVLFGDVSPSGRLPVSAPFNNYTDQSSFADMSMRRWPGRTHRYLQARACCTLVPVLYPFGHGLSYTSFSYGPLVAAPPAASTSEAQHGSCQGHHRKALLRVHLNVSNTGGMAGGDAVLLMLRYQEPLPQAPTAWQRWSRLWLPNIASTQASAAAGPPPISLDLACTPTGGDRPADVPVQALVGFERVHLQPGEAAAASFDLHPRSFEPFSPLLDTGDSFTMGGGCGGGGGNGRCPPVPQPYCGTYRLAAGDRDLLLRLDRPAASLAAA